MKKLLLLFVFAPFFIFGQTQIGQDIEGEEADDESGYSIALSDNGSIIAIGARNNDGNGNNSGHVRVFQLGSNGWIQIGDDINGEAAGDQSGSSVSLSSDGTIVAIGAPNNFGENGFSSGQVRVYEYDTVSDNWIQLGSDIDGEASGDRSGRRTSLSDDGTILAVSALGNNENGTNSGHVRVYQYDAVSDNWTQIGDDFDGEAEFSQMGSSISLSSDGTILAISDFGVNNDSGHVRVYEYNSLTDDWTQLGVDILSEDTGDSFDQNSFNIALSSDGTRLAIGDSDNDGNGSNSGHVRVYAYDSISDSWNQIGDDIDGEAAGDFSGDSISLSSDGAVVAIGAYLNNGNGNNSGHARIYAYDTMSDSWNQIGDDIDGEAAGDLCGFSVSLSSNGSFVSVGDIHNSGNGDDSGQVRIFDLSDLLTLEEQNIINFRLHPNPTKNQFTVQLNDGNSLEQIEVYTILGELLITSKKTTINTSKLSTGTYLVKITTAQGTATEKLIIE